MTFRSDPHSVLPITFKILTPRELVSSTTGIEPLSRKSCGSKFRPRLWQISKTVVSCPLLKFIQTKLQLTFNDNHVGRSVRNLKIIDL